MLVVPNNANTYLPPTIVNPGFLLITNITTTNPMIITIVDSNKNSYIVGQLVHLSVPSNYGMYQADQLTGEILAINGFDFIVNINASQFDTFVPASLGQEQPATISPAGSRNLTLDNSSVRVEPFHSLNNIGN